MSMSSSTMINEFVSSIPSILNALIKAVELTNKIHNAQEETKDFCNQIKRMCDDLVEAKRLHELSSPYYNNDPAACKYNETAIVNFGKAIEEVSIKIDKARVDLETRSNGSVRLDRRIAWVMSKENLTISKYRSLNECATRMQACMVNMNAIINNNARRELSPREKDIYNRSLLELETNDLEQPPSYNTSTRPFTRNPSARMRKMASIQAMEVHEMDDGIPQKALETFELDTRTTEIPAGTSLNKIEITISSMSDTPELTQDGQGNDSDSGQYTRRKRIMFYV